MSQSSRVGTPPTGRGLSPAPRRRASGDQRNSVVPFKRTASGGKLAESQGESLERHSRAGFAPQLQPRSVPARSQSASRFSFDLLTPPQSASASNNLPSRTIDSPFSRQEGFTTLASIPSTLDSDTQLASAPSLESPGRTRSTGLLSQQLNRGYGLNLTPADVKASSTSATALPTVFCTSLSLV